MKKLLTLFLVIVATFTPFLFPASWASDLEKNAQLNNIEYESKFIDTQFDPPTPGSGDFLSDPVNLSGEIRTWMQEFNNNCQSSARLIKDDGSPYHIPSGVDLDIENGTFQIYRSEIRETQVNSSKYQTEIECSRSTKPEPLKLPVYLQVPFLVTGNAKK